MADSGSNVESVDCGNEQEPQRLRAFGAPLTEREIGSVAERALVNDALSGDTFCAEMFSTGTAKSSVLVTDDSSAFFADRLSSFIA